MRTQRHKVHGGLVIISDDLDTAQVDEVVREEGVLIVCSYDTQDILNISEKVNETYPEGHAARMRIGLWHCPSTFEWFVQHMLESMGGGGELYISPPLGLKLPLEMKAPDDA